MDNFVRCHEAVHLVCSAIAPSIQRTLDDWHQRNLGNFGCCTSPQSKPCPNKGKPVARKGYCRSCENWGQAIENAYFPQYSSASIKWGNVNPTLFCKDPIEVAKVFVLRLQQCQTYNTLDDFDAASILMLGVHFAPYHRGDQAFSGKIEKVKHMYLNMLKELRVLK